MKPNNRKGRISMLRLGDVHTHGSGPSRGRDTQALLGSPVQNSDAFKPLADHEGIQPPFAHPNTDRLGIKNNEQERGSIKSKAVFSMPRAQKNLQKVEVEDMPEPELLSQRTNKSQAALDAGERLVRNYYTLVQAVLPDVPTPAAAPTAGVPSQNALNDTKAQKHNHGSIVVPMHMQTLQHMQEHVLQDISVGSEFTYSVIATEAGEKLEMDLNATPRMHEISKGQEQPDEELLKMKKDIQEKLGLKLKSGLQQKENPKSKMEHSPHVCKESEPLPKHVCEKAPPPPPRSMMLSSSVQTDKKEMVSKFVQTDDEPLPELGNLDEAPSIYDGLQCDCIKCCFHTRLNNQEYIIEDDIHFSKCICAIPDEKANYKFMIPFVLALSLSVMQFGSMFSDQKDIMKSIQSSQSGWKRELQVAADAPFALKIKQQIFQNLMPIGVAIGSVVSGQLARTSVRRTFIALNILGIIGCVVSCINTYSTVILGRFVYGCVGGVMISLTPKMLQQTIPMDIYNQGYGASTNFVIEAYRIVDLFIGMQLITETSSSSSVDPNASQPPPPQFWFHWRILYLLPIPFMLLSIMIFVIYARAETIEFYVRNNEKEKAIRLMKQVIQKKPQGDSKADMEENDRYYECKYREKKELGVLYTGLVPSKKQQEKDKLKIKKQIEKQQNCFAKIQAKLTGKKPEKKKKKDKKSKSKTTSNSKKTPKGIDSDSDDNKDKKVSEIEMKDQDTEKSQLISKDKKKKKGEDSDNSADRNDHDNQKEGGDGEATVQRDAANAKDQLKEMAIDDADQVLDQCKEYAQEQVDEAKEYVKDQANQLIEEAKAEAEKEKDALIQEGKDELRKTGKKAEAALMKKAEGLLGGLTGGGADSDSDSDSKSDSESDKKSDSASGSKKGDDSGSDKDKKEDDSGDDKKDSDKGADDKKSGDGSDEETKDKKKATVAKKEPTAEDKANQSKIQKQPNVIQVQINKIKAQQQAILDAIKAGEQKLRDTLKAKEDWMMDQVTKGQDFIDGKIQDVQDFIKQKEDEVLQAVNNKAQEMIDQAEQKVFAQEKKLEGEYYVDTDGQEALAEVADEVKAEIEAAKELLGQELKDALDEQVAVLNEPIEQLKEELTALKADLQNELDELNNELNDKITEFDDKVEVFTDQINDVIAKAEKVSAALDKILAFKDQMNQFNRVLCDPEHRYATWTCLALSFFNEMTGIQVLSMATFVKPTFASATPQHDFLISDKQKLQIFVASGLVGATLAPLLSTRFAHKNIFIVAHLLVGICLASSGYLLSIDQEIASVAVISVSLVIQQQLNALLIEYQTDKCNQEAFGLCNSFKIAMFTGIKQYLPYVLQGQWGKILPYQLYYAFGCFQFVAVCACAGLFRRPIESAAVAESPAVLKEVHQEAIEEIIELEDKGEEHPIYSKPPKAKCCCCVNIPCSLVLLNLYVGIQMLADAANLLGCVTAIPDEYPALIIIIALSSTILDCLALPRLAKFRFGPDRNKPKTKEEKRGLILAFQYLILRVYIYNVGYTLLSVLLDADVSYALVIFIFGAVQTFLMHAWRSSFTAYAAHDDEDLEEDDEEQAYDFVEAEEE